MRGLIEAALFQPWPADWRDSLDSTNAEARRLAEAGNAGPLWIAARRQTAGRGRRGRAWLSAQGNLYATALFPFDRDLQQASLICFVAGLAVRDAVADAGAAVADVGLKWPNDVRWSRRKLSGILVETGSMGNGLLWVAAGIGVNLRTAPETDQPTCSLQDLPGGSEMDPAAFVVLLSESFRTRLSQLLDKGFGAVRDDWLAVAEGMGSRVSVNAGDRVVTGVMTGMDRDGALLLAGENGASLRITTGDVRLID